MTRFDKLEFPDDRSDAATALPLEQRDAAHWTKLADAARRQGSHETALRLYSRSLEEDRTQPSCWLGQVQMLVLLGEAPQAETWARKALELFPRHPELLAGSAQALVRLGRVSDALAASDASLALPGESGYRWLARGETLLASRSGNDDHCFDRAVILDRDWLLPTEVALVCLHHGSPAKGLRRAQTAVERGADQGFAWYVLGRCQEESGLDAAARRSYERVVELVPGHLEAGRRLAASASVWSGLGRRLRTLLGGG